jgi:gamma-glutamylcyclotransferase (GGCT)/AIG2-like uncharacterized protein YtfP
MVPIWTVKDYTKELHHFKWCNRYPQGDLSILENYKLIFNKKTSDNDYSYANIEPINKSIVYGKIYKLTYEEIKKIDLDEGFGYDRKIFQIKNVKTNQLINAYAYIATNKIYLTNKLKPSEEYIKYFTNSDLPKEYLRMIF